MTKDVKAGWRALESGFRMDFRKEVVAQILEAGQGLLFFCDGSLRVTAVGAGIPEGQLRVGQLLREVFPGCSEELDEARGKLESGSPYYSTKFEINFVSAAVMMVPFFEDGKLSSVLCCLDSVGGKQEVSEETGALLPLVSDRYREPVSNLLNILGMLAPRFEEAEDYQALSWLNEAARSCYQMLRSVSMTAWYYHLVNHALEGEEMELLNLTSFLEKLVKKLSVLFRKTDRVLQFIDDGEEAAIVLGNTAWLGRAIFHVISNACIYSPEDSCVYIRISLNRGQVYVTVTDKGYGIPVADIERIFEPFFSRQKELIPEGEAGLGLGLPIARRIVELHGGSIFVTSTPDLKVIEDEDKRPGTSIAISLPLWEGDTRNLRIKSHAIEYEADRFSDMYLIFSDICEIKIY